MVRHHRAALSRIATKPDIGGLGLAIEQTVNESIDENRSRLEILIDLLDRHTGTVGQHGQTQGLKTEVRRNGSRLIQQVVACLGGQIRPREGMLGQGRVL